MNRDDIRPGSVLEDEAGAPWVVMAIAAGDVLLQEADVDGDPADEGNQQLVGWDELDVFTVVDY